MESERVEVLHSTQKALGAFVLAWGPAEWHLAALVNVIWALDSEQAPHRLPTGFDAANRFCMEYYENLGRIEAKQIFIALNTLADYRAHLLKGILNTRHMTEENLVFRKVDFRPNRELKSEIVTSLQEINENSAALFRIDRELNCLIGEFQLP